MIKYFPRPYPDELLYSMLARCRVHIGLNSHKRFLDMLYQDRKVAAVVDFPSHLERLSQTISINRKMDVEELVYKHTLFPLYAPFMPEQRRQGVLTAMKGTNGGTLHTRAGVSAGLVKPPHWLRVCTLCAEISRQRFGELYWRRLWQVTGIEVCPEHGAVLVDTSVPLRQLQRHEYIAVNPSMYSQQISARMAEGKAVITAKYAQQLLSLTDKPSPTYWQWSHFYWQLAKQLDATRGNSHIRHDIIHQYFVGKWPRHFLSNYNLSAIDKEDSWLASLFRKHRKSFSYLQHILVWGALLEKGDAIEVLDDVRQLPKKQLNLSSTQSDSGTKTERATRRKDWQKVLAQDGSKGVKACRNLHGQLYAWLYRYDKQWLLKANASFRLQRENNKATDWSTRDLQVVRLLLAIERTTADQLTCPRRTQSWYIKQLTNRATVEKYISKLPLCTAFFAGRTETIEEYQIRRITRCFIGAALRGEHLQRWQLERICGLSRSRTPALTDQFLQWIEQKVYEKSNF